MINLFFVTFNKYSYLVNYVIKKFINCNNNKPFFYKNGLCYLFIFILD